MRLYLEIETQADSIGLSALQEIHRQVASVIYGLVPSGLKFIRAAEEPRVVFFSINELDHYTNEVVKAELTNKPTMGGERST